MTDQTTAVAAQTPEERIAQDVAKFSPAAAKLERFRDFKTIVVNGLSDKDGLKICRANRIEVKNERVALNKLRLSLNEDAQTYIKAVNAGAKPYIEEMEAIEAHLQAEEDKIEALAEAERTKAAREREAMIESRKQELFAMGFAWNGTHFSSEFGATINEQSVVTLTTDEFAQFVANANIAKSKFAERKEAEEHAELERRRIADEEAAKQKAIAEENERKAQELAAKEKALNTVLNTSRLNELLAIGLKVAENQPRPSVWLNAGIVLYTDDLFAMSADEWESVKANAVEQFNLIEAGRIAAERQHILLNRKRLLKTAGWEDTIDNKGVLLTTEDEDVGGTHYVWNDNLIDTTEAELEILQQRGVKELLRRNEVEAERLRKEGEQRERDRIAKEQADEEIRRVQVAAKLSDFEKFTVWTKAILATKPELTSEIGKHAVNRLCDHIQDATFGVEKDLK